MVCIHQATATETHMNGSLRKLPFSFLQSSAVSVSKSSPSYSFRHGVSAVTRSSVSQSCDTQQYGSELGYLTFTDWLLADSEHLVPPGQGMEEVRSVR